MRARSSTSAAWWEQSEGHLHLLPHPPKSQAVQVPKKEIDAAERDSQMPAYFFEVHLLSVHLDDHGDKRLC